MEKNIFEKFLKENGKVIAVSSIVSILVSVVSFSLLYGGGMLRDEIFKSDNILSTTRRDDGDQMTDFIAHEERIVGIVEKSNPAVVSIVISKDVPKIEQYFEKQSPFNELFEQFFGGGFNLNTPQQRQNGSERREIGGGSGFFVSSEGLLVTNRHVVSDEDAEYTVLTNDGKKYSARVVAKDSTLDIAVLHVEGNDFPYLSFGNSEKLKPGQTVIAIGNALAEFRNSVSVGVVSGLARSVLAGDAFGEVEQLDNVIQTDAAINPGNSGGPLLDLSGRVVGVNVAVERGAENIGFALPANTVKNIVESVKKHGEIVRPYLGVRYVMITESLKEKNNLMVDYGALVQRGADKEELAVIPGSPADKAGIVENDIILEVNGMKLTPDKSLANIIREKNIGDSISMKILHKGTEKDVNIILEKAPKSF